MNDRISWVSMACDPTHSDSVFQAWLALEEDLCLKAGNGRHPATRLVGYNAYWAADVICADLANAQEG